MVKSKNSEQKDHKKIKKHDDFFDYKDTSKKEVNIEKYPALKFISTLLKFTSIMIAFISFVIFFMAFEGVPSYRANEVFMVAIIPFIYSIIAAICMYAYGELITLFIDVEKNTRNSK